MQRPLFWKFIFAVVCLSAASAYAAESSPELLAKVHKANSECLACHSEAGVKSPPRAGLDLAKLSKLQVDSSHFDKSNHTGIACTQCHSNAVASYPHDADARAKISTCEECHAAKVMRVEKQIKDSVHGGAMQEPFTCTTCHNPHRGAIAARLKDARQIALQDNKICLDCHQSDLAMAEVSGNAKPRKDIDDIHDWLPNARLHWTAVRCLECHTESDKKPHEIVNGDKAERNCVTCHSADSTLRTRLYRHQALAEQEKLGFLNSAVLSSTYVIGATRHPWLDRAIVALAALMLVGVLGHGAVRIVAALWRRKKQRNHKKPSPPAKTERVFLLALWIRLWHWTNALLILVLTVTGISLHFSNPSLPLIEFSRAARIHNIAGVLLAACYIFFVIANIVSGNWWQFVPKPPGLLKRCIEQARYYAWGIFRGDPHPFLPTPKVNFNALQTVIYWGIMYGVMQVLVITGLIFLYPQFAPDNLFGMDGLLPIALLHYLAASTIVLFMVGHIYLGTTGHRVSTLFRMMITGWHEH